MLPRSKAGSQVASQTQSVFHPCSIRGCQIRGRLEYAPPRARLLLRPRGKAAFDFAAPRRARAEKVEQRQFQRLVGGEAMVFDAEIVAGRADPVVMGGEFFQIVLSRGGRIDVEVAPGL